MPLELRSFGHGAAGWGGPHLAQWGAYARQRGYCRLPILDGIDQLLLRIEAAAGAPGPRPARGGGGAVAEPSLCALPGG